MGASAYVYDPAWDYFMRRILWKPWKWEVCKRLRGVSKTRGVGTDVYVSNLTKLAAQGYVKLLSEV